MEFLLFRTRPKLHCGPANTAFVHPQPRSCTVLHETIVQNLFPLHLNLKVPFAVQRQHELLGDVGENHSGFWERVAKRSHVGVASRRPHIGQKSGHFREDPKDRRSWLFYPYFNPQFANRQNSQWEGLRILRQRSRGRCNVGLNQNFLGFAQLV